MSQFYLTGQKSELCSDFNNYEFQKLQQFAEFYLIWGMFSETHHKGAGKTEDNNCAQCDTCSFINIE